MGVKRIYNDDNHDLEKIKALCSCDNVTNEGLFKYQSPIDFSNLPKVETDQSLALTFNYEKQVFQQEIFGNAFHLVPTDKQSSLVFDEENYWLIDIHVHFPSEHVLNFKHSECEVHFVHENDAGGKLVVGLLFDVATTGYLIKNELRRFTIMEEFETKATIFFNPNKYIPSDHSFYHFVGSLTTAPYSGPVLWFVMDNIQLVNKDLIDRVKKIVPINNNRPVFPLGNRDIYHN